MLKRTFDIAVFLLVFTVSPHIVLAQPTWTLDPFGKEKKPEQFENRTLGSERTADKKFTAPRHFMQNTITHYNYYFNANNKVNAVVDRAKLSHKDDYSKLLSFYPFDLTNTAGQKRDLDSVLYTCTAGILIHDLRNDWIDNLYLLIGESYFYKKDFDSAAMTFQFINYNLFPRKKHEDDDRVVGTNSSASGSTISIANKEKRNLPQRIFTLPPSRNDALIWLIRTFIEQNEYGDAGSLINTLQNDPNLPKRLRNDLDEVSSYWFFRQAGYDSSAAHLEKALSNADTKQDKSRWEFLLAQLLEMNHQYDKASEYYLKAAKHTVDPMMDIFARLNEAKMLKGGNNPKQLEKSIGNLTRMARKDKYETYRDIIYYAAGQLSLQQPDTSAAIGFFKKSLKYNNANISYKNKAFLQLADIAFIRKQYRAASGYYDSLQTSDTTLLAGRLAQIQSRKSALNKIADAITNIEREDSLQLIAAMQPAEREQFIRKLLKMLRKEQGLKEENNSQGGNTSPFSNNRSGDLFKDYGQGDWYFYNSALKSNGYNDFKTLWGNRANADNWRHSAQSGPGNASNVPPTSDTKTGNPENKGKDSVNTKGNILKSNHQTEITYESLMSDLPLTKEKLEQSNENLAKNLLILAKLYEEELEEYQLAAETYENYLQRFPARLQGGDVYLGLYYCYTKLGNQSKADYYKNLLDTKFPNAKPGRPNAKDGQGNYKAKDPEVTKLYDEIYNHFIEGDFDQALLQKKKADSLYGVNYWTPQLLYIEAIYNVKQHNDSLAIQGLQTLMNTYPASPLKAKAANLIDVLRRRKEIETYLTNLQVTRDTGQNLTVQANNNPVVKKEPPAPEPKETVKKEVPLPPLANGTFTLSPSSPHYVIMILDKVDAVFVNESKNGLTRYNQEKFYGQNISIVKEPLDADRNLLVISPFADADAALGYYDKVKRDAKTEISWLPTAKYSFLIITEQNLQLLISSKDINGYRNLLNTRYPNRF